VDKVVSKATGKVYARKRIERKTFGHDSHAQKIFENELHTLKMIGEHDHLIRIRGTYTDKKYLVMLLEPVADGNLKQFLESATGLSDEGKTQFRAYFGCLAYTVAFLHQSEVLHKDLKPENILLKDSHLILTDFGTAFDWSKTGQSMTRSNSTDARTPRYQSPEIATANEFHRSSDIWSLGVVFLEMVSILREHTLAELDSFLSTRGTRATAVHQNLEAAMKWVETLQTTEGGPFTDNEPLTWIKEMLEMQQFDRPSATDLHEQILSFHDGRFCGRCCSGEDSDSDTDFSTHSDSCSTVRQSSRAHIGGVAMANNGEPLREASSQSLPGVAPGESMNEKESQELASSYVFPGSFPMVEEAVMSHSIEEIQSPNDLDDNLQDGLKERKSPKSHASGAPATAAPSSRKATAKNFRIRSTGHSSINERPNQARENIPVKPKPFLERETFIKWLSGVSEKFSLHPMRDRSRTVSAASRHQIRRPFLEAQLINHFLATLPEEATEYEDAVDGGKEYVAAKPPIRSSTMPEFFDPQIKRSSSQDNFLTSSYVLREENEASQFAGVTKSRLIHYASDGDLCRANISSQDSQRTIVEELKSFGRSVGAFAERPIDDFPSTRTNISPETALNEVDDSTPASMGRSKSTYPSFALATLPTSNFTASVKQLNSPLQLPAPSNAFEPNVASPRVRAASFLDDLQRARGHDLSKPHVGTSSPNMVSLSASAGATTLGQFISQGPKRKRQWESATVIMERILKSKASVASTSVISARSRALVSGRRPVLRWNDRSYGYLPHFVARGKAHAVRELLSAGCNPGTEAKPRWGPMYNAIRGATDNHTKCLMALITHGANVNATHLSNGKTPLHYAIEVEPWSGYSTVVYVLLANKADPNIRDKAEDLPLLMLLIGNGPLSQEKRDALLLLLAPNYNTCIDVKIPGTLDNPLHLATRRKDAHTVEAILEKMKQLSSLDGQLLMFMHSKNGSGFTPILLAFTIFNFDGEDVEEELQIVKLLLKHGANPDDQDAEDGNTPLHLVVKSSRNAVALEYLCRSHASPRIINALGVTALDLTSRKRVSYAALPGDKWYGFAERRMTNKLGSEDYRPPELLAFLAEEREQLSGTQKAKTPWSFWG
jgi:serine/threonine protein kinase